MTSDLRCIIRGVSSLSPRHCKHIWSYTPQFSRCAVQAHWHPNFSLLLPKDLGTWLWSSCRVQLL
ncbi:hypothetical protein PISMIDRAFT_406489 [Pisolithus microcarpus 441]|uniref:Uncharacterized protein n=1 Tax=Pisolithus microcarpus 441 TaxID=765257 RepID=A0A0C9YSM1_9AGAM|nr:hypothetical protein PISMIDRAFT_406489 [Pisolithus microcarpus 441]